MGNLQPKSEQHWRYRQLPLTAYDQAQELQQRAVVWLERTSATALLLLLEHPPVFTLGRRGGLVNLKVSPAFLESKGIDVIATDRGGDITYHGPGQLIGYPVIDLGRAGLSVVDLVTGLEDVLIRTVAEWGIQATRNTRNRGIWVGHRKLGSIGLHVARHISTHGFALNVNPDLTPFNWINPCGLQNIGMTSMALECNQAMDLPQISDAVCRQMARVFGIVLQALPETITP